MFIKSKEAYDRLVELNRDAQEKLFIPQKIVEEKKKIENEN